MYLFYTITSLQGGLSGQCTAPSGEATKLLTVLVGPIYTAGWTGAMKVSCSRKQQQQQLMELSIEPGTLQLPGQCSNHSAILPQNIQCTTAL